MRPAAPEHDRHILGGRAGLALEQENGGRTDVPMLRADTLRWRVATVARRARDARDEAYRLRIRHDLT